MGMRKKLTNSETNEIIAKVVLEEWPRFPTQKKIAKALSITQPEVSHVMANWEKNEDNIPLSLIYTGRSTEREDALLKSYNLKDVVIIPSVNSVTSPNAYFKKIGAYATDLLTDKIYKIIDARTPSKRLKNEETMQVRISITAAGRSVSNTITQLASHLKGSNISLKLVNCVALRSNIQITPGTLLFESFLSNDNTDISVGETYHFPPYTVNNDASFQDSNNHEHICKVLGQRATTNNRLNFYNNFIESDIAIFGLGNVASRYTKRKSRFMSHLSNENLEALLEVLNIEGEIACSPYNTKGFIFPLLEDKVFKMKTTNIIPNNKTTLIKRLHKITNSKIKDIQEEHVIQAINLFSSIFTLDFNQLSKRCQDSTPKKPYVLLVIGGKHKAKPLATLLDLWGLDKQNVIDGIVMDEQTAIELIDMTKEKKSAK